MGSKNGMSCGAPPAAGETLAARARALYLCAGVVGVSVWTAFMQIV